MKREIDPDDPRKFIRIYATLRHRIEQREIPPGERLDIGDLAAEFKASRDTVQAALKMLNEDGFARRWPGIGWQVSSRLAT